MGAFSFKYDVHIRERGWRDEVTEVKKNGKQQEEDEGLRKLRRRIEDFLRKTKDKSLILKVADLLGIRYDKSISNNKHG
jgi:hypothetical protein